MNEEYSMEFRLAKLMHYIVYVFFITLFPIICCVCFDIHIVVAVVYFLVVGIPLCFVGYDLIIEAKDW